MQIAGPNGVPVGPNVGPAGSELRSGINRAPSHGVVGVTDMSLIARGRWHTMVFGLISTWLVCGLGLIIASTFGARIAWWALVHSFTLGVVTTAILTYSLHFTEALTRQPTSTYRPIMVRISIVQIGLILLLFDTNSAGWSVLSDIGASAITIVVGWHCWVLYRMLKTSLSTKFAATVPFYLTALGFLIAAIVVAIIASHGIGDYTVMISIHSRLTIWGFAWLTVLGTIVTLLPTLTQTTIPPAVVKRCTGALALHSGGLIAGSGFLTIGWNSWAGLSQLSMVISAVLIMQPLLSSVFAGHKGLRTASISVMTGIIWLLSLCAADAIAVTIGAETRDITRALAPAFLGAGLLQLVTGVLLHLLPTLRGGGNHVVTAAREFADFGGWARIGLINFGALLTLADPPAVHATSAFQAGLILIALGIAGQVAVLIITLFRAQQLRKTS